MGKATITGGGANGLYNISIKYDNARAKARLDAINSQIDQLNNTLIPQALDNKNIAQAQHDTALSYLNDYLNSVTPEQFDPSISGQLTVQAMKTKSVYDEANKAYKKLVLQETALGKEKTKLQNAPEDEAAQAWCADFTEDLTGDVGVIDVGYEDKDIRIIRPHAIEGAGYNAASDGIISSFFNHTAHQLYTNRAYLPALAKWKPRYRTGSITSLTGDTCNVSLDPYVSSQQKLDINQSTSLTGVPIEYMTCNGAAFEVGDSVVVDFSLDWATPRVIGFVSNPRECPDTWSLSFTYAGWNSLFLDYSSITITDEVSPNETLNIIRNETRDVCVVPISVEVALRHLEMEILPETFTASGVSNWGDLNIEWESVANSQGQSWDEYRYVQQDNRDIPVSNPPTTGTCTGLEQVDNTLSSNTVVTQQLSANLPEIGMIEIYDSTVAHDNYYQFASAGRTRRLVSGNGYNALNYSLNWELIEIIDVSVNEDGTLYTYSVSTTTSNETYKNGEYTLTQDDPVVTGPFTTRIYVHTHYSEGVVKIESKTVDLGPDIYKHAPHLSLG